eukprot:TRINITY_DN5636_c0_g1_i1.p3 TRINITY_DN5636_c0_g1~~TRINITY_DN5636_c0_g1_i1.p3  ORF type:complete len:70 (-),score=16.17 TRINITY_DN5636_c0_g1_i1:165-374(-)
MIRCWDQNPQNRPTFHEIHSAIDTILRGDAIKPADERGNPQDIAQSRGDYAPSMPESRPHAETTTESKK